MAAKKKVDITVPNPTATKARKFKTATGTELTIHDTLGPKATRKTGYVSAGVLALTEDSLDYQIPRVTRDHYTLHQRLDEWGGIFTRLGRMDRIVIGFMCSAAYQHRHGGLRPGGGGQYGDKQGARVYYRQDVDIIDTVVSNYIRMVLGLKLTSNVAVP